MCAMSYVRCSRHEYSLAARDMTTADCTRFAFELMRAFEARDQMVTRSTEVCDRCAEAEDAGTEVALGLSLRRISLCVSSRRN
jgi:hypothetical protein